MKAINRRLQTLEQRYMPQGHEAGPSKADVSRVRYRRRMQASGEPCVPLPPRNDVAGNSIAEVLRSRFCRRGPESCHSEIAWLEQVVQKEN